MTQPQLFITHSNRPQVSIKLAIAAWQPEHFKKLILELTAIEQGRNKYREQYANQEEPP